MTPAARIAAAIEVLDLVLDGATPEKSLTGWGRTHRFAGSKDRAAIRDHVFQALRCRASFAWIGGAETGRGIMLGATHVAENQDVMFTGEGHAPQPVGDDEIGQDINAAPRGVRYDMPDWMLPYFDATFGDDADQIMTCLQSRAGVFLRVNAARITVQKAAAMLEEKGIKTEVLGNVKNALQVIENERRVALSAAYLDGLVELQDPSSQTAILSLNLQPGQRVLDLCAGGGGKALAMAALGADVTAHDIDPRRMIDLAPRAERAGVEISTLTTDELGDAAPFDLVLCDAPCSGSGTWRRTPAAKWELNEERLTELTRLQDDVLASAIDLVKVGGTLAYATCSVFQMENNERIEALMMRCSSFSTPEMHQTPPHVQGDGFFLATMVREG